MNNPWLSVLIPTYNGGKYIESTLNSIISQGSIYTDIEYIVVDDGSTDNTISILKSFQEKINLKIIQREPQKNWVTNTNYALSLARSEYISFLHQDDIWMNDRLLILKNLTREFPNVNLILHASKFIDIQGNDLGLWTCPLPAYPQLIDCNIVLKKLLIQNFISIPSPIFKRESALRVGGLDEKLWYTADWDFWLKLAAQGAVVYYPKPLAAFRVHPDSQTVTRSSYIQDFRKQLEMVINKHLDRLVFPPRLKKKIRKIAQLSIEINIALASVVHGKKIKILPLIFCFLSVGIQGWYCYLRDSRIYQRVSARVKTKLTVVERDKNFKVQE
jgi:glycosyltransferase involved in cell wall biosynthesis